ncbi:MAG: hypothetical protein GX379_06190 [Clostridiales bacterium]|jgi:hypothetical protein|nr:hypothetical protein [Clostridiales bacterium]
MSQSLRTITTSAKDENIEIVYNLIFKNALYSLECIRVGSNDNETNNYCYVENITDDEGEAELFLKILAKGMVFPVHIKDMIDDYFY